MHTWHLARQRAIVNILETEAFLLGVDALLARFDLRDRRDAPTRAALQAAKLLGLLRWG